MDLYYGIADDRTKTPDHAKASNDVDQWQRWDEELVEQFDCWLRRPECVNENETPPSMI
jgi:hypothetical protein